MHFSLVYVSEKPNPWAEEACQLYVKRLPSSFGFQQIRITPAKRTKNTHIESVREQEWQLIKEKIPRHATLVLLDERGKEYTSKKFSQQIDTWQHNGQDVVFVIAGADGVNSSDRNTAETLIALSQLTLPHEMARLFLIEQLYRGWSILHNHPYHRT